MGGQAQSGKLLRWPDHLVLQKLVFDALWKVTKDFREARMRGFTGQAVCDYAVAKQRKLLARRKRARVK